MYVYSASFGIPTFAADGSDDRGNGEASGTSLDWLEIEFRRRRSRIGVGSDGSSNDGSRSVLKQNGGRLDFFGGASRRVVGGGGTTIDGPGGVQARVSAVGGAEAAHFLAPVAGSRLPSFFLVGKN